MIECPECEKGELKRTGKVWYSYPLLREYKCSNPNCSHIEQIADKMKYKINLWK